MQDANIAQRVRRALTILAIKTNRNAAPRHYGVLLLMPIRTPINELKFGG